jgi:hypothetical protein
MENLQQHHAIIQLIHLYQQMVFAQIKKTNQHHHLVFKVPHHQRFQVQHHVHHHPVLHPHQMVVQIPVQRMAIVVLSHWLFHLIVVIMDDAIHFHHQVQILIQLYPILV